MDDAAREAIGLGSHAAIWYSHAVPYGVRFSGYYEGDRRDQPDRERITIEMCERVVTNPVASEPSLKDRMAYWGYVEGEDRYLKVVVEPDGEEVVTAHFDRGFGRRTRRQG